MDIADATSAAADASAGGYGSDTSASGGSDQITGGLDYDLLAEIDRITSGSTALGDVKAAAEIFSDMLSMGYTPYGMSEADYIIERELNRNYLASLGINPDDPFGMSMGAKVVALPPSPAPAPVNDPFGQAYIDYQEQVQRDLAEAQDRAITEAGDQGVMSASTPVSTSRSLGGFGSGFGRVRSPAPAPAPLDEFQAVMQPPYGMTLPEKAQEAYVNALVAGKPEEVAYLDAIRVADNVIAAEGKMTPELADAMLAGPPSPKDTYQTPYTQEDLSPVVGGAFDFVTSPATPTGGVATVDLGGVSAPAPAPAPTAAAPAAAAPVFDPLPNNLYNTLSPVGRDVYNEALGTGVSPEEAFSRATDFETRYSNAGFTGDATTEAINDVLNELAASSRDYGLPFDERPSVAPPVEPPAAPPVEPPAASQERNTLASAIDALRSGNLAGALSALRAAVGITTTPEIPPEEFVGPSIPSNIVGTETSGILTDAQGNPVLSTSYGLPGEYVAETPELPSGLLELAAQVRGMTVEELRNEIDIAASNGEMIGVTGLDRQSLEALQQAGYGGKDVGSGSQTVDQALASMQANEFLTDYLPTILGTIGPPGTGAFLSGFNTLSQLLSGRITPGQAITTELLGALARQFNVPPSVLTSILEGRFGDAAANQTRSLIYGTLAKESGVPGSMLGVLARELGITEAIDPLTKAVDTAVTGVVPDQNFGIPGQIASGIDTVVGPVQEAITSGLGGLGGVLQEAGQGIASGIGTVTTGVGDLIGNLVDAITGAGAGTVVDESGIGGVDPNEYDFKEDRVYETGGDGSILDAADLGFTDYGGGGAGTGTGSVGLPGEELGEGVFTGVDEWDQSLIEADTGGVYPGTGSVGLPGEELGEGILTGVDEWDQALIEADTGDVYGIGGGDTGGAGTGVGVGAGTGVDTGGAGGDTGVAAPPPPMIPATGGGTTQMFGNYYSRVPTGYQIVQGPYGPLMQYTYGNVALGGV